MLIIGFLLAYQFVAPAPPRRITIGTGSKGGAYYAYAKIYQNILAGYGIELHIKNTAGSAENVQLLETDPGGADVAFVQGGLKTLATTDQIVSLGSLFFEPLWIFHRHGIELKRLPDLTGLRVAVGGVGSGTRILALELLKLNGISEANTRIVPIGNQQAADMLQNGELDAAIFVANHRASYVLELLKSRSVKLIGLERAAAYALRYHYLYVLKLPEGVIDFSANIPPSDFVLVAPTTQLVVKRSLHPALTDLLLLAAKKAHYKGGGFEREGEFPTPRFLDFELSEEAERFYRTGPPFLQRFLPFWVATFLTRMKIMLLPLVVLLFPLFKIVPQAYRWKMRSKIYRWYSKLEDVDPQIHKENLQSHVDDYLLKLDHIEEQVSAISVPLSFSEELYALRLHIGMLRNKLLKIREDETQQ